MRKYLFIKGLISGLVLLAGIYLNGQAQLRMLDDFGRSLYDINNQGHALHGNGYYDFATDVSSTSEEGVGSTIAINDDGVVLGQIIDENGDFVAAIRVNGVWTALPADVPLTSDDTLHDISANGEWICGQTAWNPDDNSAWGFTYNLVTHEFRLLSSDLYEYSAAYGVNSDGYAVGWVDDLEYGTLRMPCIFEPDGNIILLGEDSGQTSQISDSGLVSGDYMGEAIIYNMITEEMQSFSPTSGFFSYTFAGISEDGVAIGYGVLPGFARKPIIYHPSWEAPKILGEFLMENGIDGSELAGTGYRISSDGKYVCGFGDGPAFMAPGWAVYFDDFFDGGDDDCPAADVPYYQDFESAEVPNMPECTTVENAGEGNNWDTISDPYAEFEGTYLRYKWNADHAADSWFYTQGVNLTAGTNYTITYDYGAASAAAYPEKMKVAFGTVPFHAAMNNILADHHEILTGGEKLTNTVNFQVTSDGVYYFGFNAYSDADMFYLFLDNIKIELKEDGPGPEDDCFVEYTGTFENGMGDMQELLYANDFQVEPNTIMTVNHVSFHIFSNIGSASVLSFYNSGGGEPGSQIQSFTNLFPSTQLLVGNNFGLNIYEVTFELPTPIELEGGSAGALYWVGLQTTAGSENQANYWEYASVLTNSPAKYSEDGGMTWNSTGASVDTVFKVSGNCEDYNPNPPGECEWTVHVTLAGYGDETSYTLKNEAGDIIISGQNFTFQYDGSLSATAEGPLEFYIETLGTMGDNEVTYSVSNGDQILVEGHLNGGEEATYSDLICTGTPPSSDCGAEYPGTNDDGLGDVSDISILAADFPVGQELSMSLESAKIWMVRDVSAVEISFYTDDNGKPGEQLITPTTLAPESQTLIGQTTYEANVYELVLDLTPLELTLEGGENGAKYWMTVTTFAGDEPGGNFWVYATQVNNGTNFWFSEDDYVTWHDAGDYGYVTDGAFEITGNCDGDTPEPPEVNCSQGDVTTQTFSNGYDIEASTSFRTAEDFTVEEDTTFSLSRITIDTNQGELPNNIVIYIREDNNGTPGEILDELFYDGPSDSNIYATAFGDPVYHMTFYLPEPITYGPGTYWLDPKMSVASGATVWWLATSAGSDGAIPQRSEDDGQSWFEDPNGLRMVFSVAGYCETLGISDINKFDFTYYPNPVQDILNIKSDKKVEYMEAYNLAGQRVLNNLELTAGRQVNVSGLPAGVYVFRAVLSDGSVETFKIIKK